MESGQDGVKEISSSEVNKCIGQDPLSSYNVWEW